MTERIQQLGLRQPAPLEQTNPSWPDHERVWRFPDAGKLRNIDAGLCQMHNDLARGSAGEDD